MRRRGDPAPPHAQARLPMLTDMSPKPHIQELQDVSPKPHIQELQDVSPKPHIQEPGCEPQTSHPKQHDDHSNDHVQSASQTGALSPSDRSDLEVFCIAASAIDITGLLPDDLTGITGALHAYRGLQRRRPVVEIARRVANEVKRTMPDDGRADHKRVVGWFMSVASTTLRRGGGVSVAGTTRNPGKLHSDFPPQEGKEDWRVEYERAQKWHESQRGDIASGGG